MYVLEDNVNWLDMYLRIMFTDKACIGGLCLLMRDISEVNVYWLGMYRGIMLLIRRVSEDNVYWLGMYRKLMFTD